MEYPRARDAKVGCAARGGQLVGDKSPYHSLTGVLSDNAGCYANNPSASPFKITWTLKLIQNLTGLPWHVNLVNSIIRRGLVSRDVGLSANYVYQLISITFACFGNPVKPREWFLVPLFVVNEVIERIKDGTITEYVYDAPSARLVKAAS